MSSIHSNGMDTIIKNGIQNGHNFRAGVEGTVDDSTAGYNTLLTTESSNPRDFDPGTVTVVQVNGSIVESVPEPTFESSSNGQTLNQYKTRYEETSSSGAVDWAIWNNGGAGFGEAFDLGAEGTIADWDIDAQRGGIAEAIVSGANNLNADIYLLNGSLNRFGEAWARKTGTAPSEDINAGSGGLFYNNDKSFTNNTGGDRTVGGIEVVWNGSGRQVIFVDHTDVTVGDGATITYTTLEVNFSGLS